MSIGKCIRVYQHGIPERYVKVEKLGEVPGEVGEGEVVWELVASPINPSDLGTIMGSYGKLPALPFIPGREGVGRVVKVGDGVDKGLIGRLVKIPEEVGCWREWGVGKVGEMYVVPEGVDEVQAGMGFINPPTAMRLLKDFVKLEVGDWVIQNAGNSAVGQCVIKLAKMMKVRTLNLVRDAHWQHHLYKIGADVVVTEAVFEGGVIEDLTGGKKARLGLNSVGGNSALLVMKGLGDRGVHVTFGGMTVDTVRFPTRALLFDDVTMKGFWLDRWVREHGREEVWGMYDEVFEFMKKGGVEMAVEHEYGLEEVDKALLHAQKGHRHGKVVLRR